MLACPMECLISVTLPCILDISGGKRPHMLPLTFVPVAAQLYVRELGTHGGDYLFHLRHMVDVIKALDMVALSKRQPSEN